MVATLPRVKGALLAPLRTLGVRWGHSQLRRRGYAGLFLAAPEDALRPDWADLWFLYRTVRARRPRCVLEFGSGCSTAIMASALAENARDGGEPGHLYSVESSAAWADVTRRYVPEPARPYCTLLVTPVVTAAGVKGIRVLRHATVPDVRPDLVYLDGPPLTAEARVADDLLRLEDQLAARCFIVVDGRKENALFLRRHLRGRYRYRWRHVFYNGWFEALD